MKKETKKITCKNLCVDCQNHYNNYVDAGNNEDLCKAHEARKSTSCINGETHTSTVRCIEHNDKGQCKLYTPKPQLQLIKVLEKYIADNPLDCFCRSTVELIIVEDLLRAVKGESSNYFEIIYTDDDPYSGHVVATKKAINRSITMRGYNVEAATKEYCGSYVDPMTPDEAKKEKNWIRAVKRWLAIE